MPEPAPGRRRAIVATAAVAIVAAAGAGGYLIGRSSGEDLDAAAAAGSRAGRPRPLATDARRATRRGCAWAASAATRRRSPRPTRPPTRGSSEPPRSTRRRGSRSPSRRTGPDRRQVPSSRTPGAMLSRVDRALVRGLTQGRLSRRQLLRGAGGRRGRRLRRLRARGLRDRGHPRHGRAGRLQLERVLEPPAGRRGPRLGELAALHRHQAGSAPVDRRVHAEDRDRRQLQAGDPGQRLVLRPDQPGPPGQAVDRLRPDRDLRRLGAHPDDRQPLADPARPLADPELLPLRRADRAGARRSTPRTPTRSTWQAGITGIAYDRKQISREHRQRQRPLRPGVRGQGRDDVRRHRARLGRDAGARDRPEDLDPGRLAASRRPAAKAARRRDRPPVLRPELHQGARGRRHLDQPGVVRRHLPGPTTPATPSSSS